MDRLVNSTDLCPALDELQHWVVLQFGVTKVLKKDTFYNLS